MFTKMIEDEKTWEWGIELEPSLYKWRINKTVLENFSKKCQNQRSTWFSTIVRDVYFVTAELFCTFFEFRNIKLSDISLISGQLDIEILFFWWNTRKLRKNKKKLLRSSFKTNFCHKFTQTISFKYVSIAFSHIKSLNRTCVR